ncbi:Domain of unknown function DUF1833 [uncultured Caudovirales phage]|uniref:DUF1833 domain-containing protein n=1 Tax=uncultured Caudovirales phage TaxID=2100421 RepID=A0A6J7WRS1_9CAUD|nr:Domain of unknown function DUF1833 [uncultured Caudovirales phage]
MRSLSSRALSSAFAAQTDEVWLVLLTITHATLSTPLRFVNDYQSLTSRGNVYLAFPFEVEFPEQDPDSAGEARLTIDNIDRQIVNTIRAISSPPEVKLEIILASQPDTVEAEFSGLVLRNVAYDALKVSGTLRFEDIMTEPVSLQMTPARFPGMF